jgi:hypothetical protein
MLISRRKEAHAPDTVVAAGLSADAERKSRNAGMAVALKGP